MLVNDGAIVTKRQWLVDGGIVVLTMLYEPWNNK